MGSGENSSERRFDERRNQNLPPPGGIERRTGQRRGAMVAAEGKTIARRARRYAAGLTEAAQCLAFWIADEEYGLPLESLREIMFVTTITAVPRAPENIVGVLSLRGEMVAVVDLRLRLGLDPWKVTPRSRIIVVKHEGELFGFTVDIVSGVVRFSPENVETGSHLASSQDAEAISGILHKEERMIILLNLERLLTFADSDVTRSLPESP